MKSLIRPSRCAFSLPGALGLEALERRVLLATYTVSTVDDVIDPDDGLLSLREAIIEANANPGSDTVVLSSDVYALSIAGESENDCQTGDLDVCGTLEIQGDPSGGTIVDAAGMDRVFEIRPDAIVSMSHLTIQNGQAEDTAGGGGIANLGDLTVSHCTVRSNKSGQGKYGGNGYNSNDGGDGGHGGAGGGIHNRSGATLKLTNCTITGNTAGDGGDGGHTYAGANASGGDGGQGGHGGGIYNGSGAMLTIADSAFSDNVSGSGGWGGKQIYGDGSAVDGGDGGSGGHGGAIYNDGGTVTITGSTLSGNAAGSGGMGGSGSDAAYQTAIPGKGGDGGDGGWGGAIYSTGGNLTLGSCALSDHIAGGGAQGGASGMWFNAGTAYWAGTSGDPGSAGGIYAAGSLSVNDSTFTACRTHGGRNGNDDGVDEVRDGRSGGDGGGFYVTGEATLSGVTLSENHTGAGGGGVDGNGYKHDGGKGGHGGKGGALYIALTGNVTFTGSTLSGNYTGQGGSGGQAHNTTHATGGEAGDGGHGGAVWSEGSLSFSGGALDSNYTGKGGVGGKAGEFNDLDGGESDGGSGGSGGNGGALYVSGTLSLTDAARVSGNYTGDGGAGGTAYFDGQHAPEIGGDGGGGGCGGDGGALYFVSGTAAVHGVSLTGNSTGAGGNGGAGCDGGSAVEDIAGGAGDGGDGGRAGHGGTAYLHDGTVQMDTCAISNNTTGDGGEGGHGGHAPSSGTGGNGGAGAIGGNGAGIYSNVTLSLTDCELSANTTGGGGNGGEGGAGHGMMPGWGGDAGAGGSGGALFILSGSATMTGGTLSANQAGTGGRGGAGGEPEWGTAGDGGAGGDGGFGGGVHVHNGQLTLVNATVKNNSAGAGGDGGPGGSGTGLSTLAATPGQTADGGDGGDGGDAGSGGGICLWRGSASISGATITENRTESGGDGGDKYDGPLGGTHDGDGGNGGFGGGVHMHSGTLTLSGSTVSDNTALGHGGDGHKHGLAASGGGVANWAGTLTVASCLIWDNTTYGASNPESTGGGGIYMGPDSNSRVRNTTISGNMSHGWGGGLFLDIDFDRGEVVNCTIIDNHSHMDGGGIYVPNVISPDGTLKVDLDSSIVTGNWSERGVANNVENYSGSHNIIGEDAKLQPLGWYGGPTFTAPPKHGSPAIDAGANPNSLDSDQRGAPRTYGSQTDIGACEYADAVWIDLDTTAPGTGYETEYVSGMSPRIFGENARIWNDVDQVRSAQVKLDYAPDGAAEDLVMTEGPLSGVTADYDSEAKLLTLTGAANVASYEWMLSKIVYENTSESPTRDDRTVDVWPNHDSGGVDRAQTTLHVVQLNTPVVAGFGNVLTLDGADDHVEVLPVVTGDSNWTFSAWIKPTSDGSQVIYSEGKAETTFWVRLTETQQIEIGSINEGWSDWTTYATSAYVVEVGEWNFIAASLYGGATAPGELTVWVNDQSYHSRLWGSFAEGTQFGAIGANVAGLHGGNQDLLPFQGTIDEVRIWDLWRQESDVRGDQYRTLTGDEPGLWAYWPLDDGQGDVIWDASSRGNLGQALGNPTWATSSVPAGLAAEESGVLDGHLFAGPDPKRSSVVYEISTQPDHGVLALDPDLAGGFTYTPEPHWSGNDQFSFRASRDGGESWSDHAYTADITVNPAGNQAPVSGFGYVVLVKDHMEVTPGLNGLSEWTFSSWVLPPRTGKLVLYSEGSPDATLKIEVDQYSVYVSTWHEDYAGNWMTFKAPSVLRGGFHWNPVTVTLSGGGPGEGLVTVYGSEGKASGPLQMASCSSTQYAAIGANIGAFHGGSQDPGTPDAELDEIRLWDVALTEEQIEDYRYRTLTGTEYHLLSYWQMDDNGGDMAWDATGKGNDAVIYEGAEWTNATGIHLPYSGTRNQRVSGSLFGHDYDRDAITYEVTTYPGYGTVTLDADTGHFVYTPQPEFHGSDGFNYGTVDAHGLHSPSKQSVDITIEDKWVLNTAGFGRAVSLGGGLDYINCGNDTSLDISDEITVEAWVRPGQMANNNDVLRKGHIRLLHWDEDLEEALGHGFQINLAGTDSGWWEFHTSTELDEWTHVAWTYSSDSGAVHAYVDGELVRSGTLSGSIQTNTDDFIIGGAGDGDGFIGMFDEVRIWNVARTAEEIRSTLYSTVPVAEPGLVSCWHFDEGWGYVAHDSKGCNGGALEPGVDWLESAVPVPYRMDENTPVSGTLFGVDWQDGTDPEGYRIDDEPQHGSLTLDTDTGAFTYTPNAGWYGDDSFTFRISDWAAGGWSQNKYPVSLTVDFVNQPPTANNDAFAGDEDQTLTGNVLNNDTDPDGDTLSAQVASLPDHGTLTLLGNGYLTYTPDLNWSGTDSFAYVAYDGTAYSDAATVTLTVNPVDDQPFAGFGGALQFRGGHVETAATVNRLADWTWEAWVMPSTGDYCFLYSEGNPQETLNILATSSQAVSVGTWNAKLSGNWLQLSTPSGVLDVGEWNYVAVTLSGGSVGTGTGTIYVNDQQFTGTLQMVDDGNTDGAALGDNIGSTGTGGEASHPFTGVMDEVRIWDHARSAGELLASRSHTLTGGESGLLRYWRFDDVQGAEQLWDAASGEADAAIVGRSGWRQSGIPVICTTRENVAVDGVLFGADVEGDAFTFEVAVQPENGAVHVVAQTGAYTLTPADKWYGTDQFTFAVREDGQAWSLDYPVDVTVTWVNQPPSFTKGADQLSHQSAGPQTVRAGRPRFRRAPTTRPIRRCRSW